MKRYRNILPRAQASEALSLGVIFCAFIVSSCSDAPSTASNIIEERATGQSEPERPSGYSFRDDEAPAITFSETSANAISPISSTEDPDGEFDLSAGKQSGGSFSLAITDAPDLGIDALNVKFTKADLRNKDTGERFTLLANPVSVNLLDLRDGISQAFGSASLPRGKYHQLRFFVSDVSVLLQGKTVGVEVPKSVLEGGIRIFGTFDIKDGTNANVVIDFDAPKLLSWSLKGPVFRPIAKLRHLHFSPGGIRFEESAGGRIQLIGPEKSVRAKAWLSLKLPNGVTETIRAKSDGSFLFSDVPRVFGTARLSVLGKKERDGKVDREKKNGGALAWIDLELDLAADSKYPQIRASHLERLFAATYASAGSESQFLAKFNTDVFRYLAGRYIEIKGLSLPGGFQFPSLPVPYPFALEGPDFELPGYAHEINSIGFFSGGPQSSGCSDARHVFEAGSASEFGALNVDDSVWKMKAAGLPFTGLLAEYQVACRGNSLSQVSCGTLGALASASNNSLPADFVSSLSRSLNSPRGGLLVSLLSCIRPGSELSLVELPALPESQPACWFGCAGGPDSHYLHDSSLLSESQVDSILGADVSILGLDSLVLLADQAQVHPLALVASYIAYKAPSKVHGFADRAAPSIYNLLPRDGLETEETSVLVSGNLTDRSVASVRINGESASFALAADGSVAIAPHEVALVHGQNSVVIEAVDASGNFSSASLNVVAHLNPPTTTTTTSTTSTTTSTLPPEPVPTTTTTTIPGSRVSGVDDLCSTGSFVPKPVIKVGISIDSTDASFVGIQTGFTNLGFPPVAYTDEQVMAGLPIQEGVSVLVVARKILDGALSTDYVNGVRSFIQSGGSVLGEFDGAALFFNEFVGPGPSIPNFSPSFGIFTGIVAGGDAILPLTNSTMYVSDANHPLMANMPGSMLIGVRTAYAVSGFNNSWLHESATFATAGTGMIPAGSYPAVLSGSCGAGRVALFTMNHLSVINRSPASIMFGNAVRWLTGN